MPRLRFGIHSPALGASINLQLVSLATPAGGDLIRRHQHGHHRGVASWLEERMHTVEQFSRGPRGAARLQIGDEGLDQLPHLRAWRQHLDIA
jgi:hypothetical protein